MVSQGRQEDISKVSDSVSLYALICLVVIFLLIVTFGWSTMLTPVVSLPNQWPDFLSPFFTLLRYVAGFAIALAGIILGKAVAAERIRISSEDQPKFKTTWCIFR